MPTCQPETEDPQRHTLYFGPFCFDSEIDIPELRDSVGTNERSVRIGLGNVPVTLEAATPYGTFAQVTPEEYLLNIEDVARYYVAHGNEVRVEIVPGTPIANVTTYLLGSVFGVLCHQNGMLPLHASAVEHRGAVVAFLGDSGAGKSTLAACLQRRNYRVVSDDICLLQPHDDAMRVVPVAGWLKLWNQSLQHLGHTAEEQHRVFSTDDKFRVFLQDSGLEQAHLGCVVFLAKAPEVNPQARPSLQPLSTVDAIAGLMDMTYVSYVPALAGQRTRMFQQCARAFQHARAFRLTVPWGLEHMDAVLDLLEREILNPIAQ